MTPERWSVWLANLDPVVGSEQGRTRPVLVLSDTRLNQILPVVNALPITSRKHNRRIYPNEALIPAGTAGLDLESIVLSVIRFAPWTSSGSSSASVRWARQTCAPRCLLPCCFNL